MQRKRPALFRGRHFEDQIIVLCVRWYLRYSLSYRDLEEMMAERNLGVDHSTIARWVLRYGGELNKRIRRELRHPNRSWRGMRRTFESPGAGLTCTAPSIRRAIRSDFMLSPNRDAIAAKHFLRWTLTRVGEIRPRVINVDGHPAYRQVIADLKRAGELGRTCRCRPAPYLNNVIEQNQRFIKKRIAASLWFRSVDGARNTIEGYEAMHMIRKGQLRWLPKGDTVGQVRFVNHIFGLAV